MTDRLQFILNFIDCFYDKSLTKRRSSKNTAHYIARTVNKVFKFYFDKSVKYTEEEIYKAFEINGYSLMKSGKQDFTWHRYDNGHILITCDLFINIKPQKNSDLIMTMRKSYPDTLKPETLDRINSCKSELRAFWNKNQHLVSK